MGIWKKWADRLLTLAFGVCVLAVVWCWRWMNKLESQKNPANSKIGRRCRIFDKKGTFCRFQKDFRKTSERFQIINLA